MTATAIDINAVTKTFPAIGSAAVSTAVDAVTLRINPGELFFLLGPSGCGKTTLLRIIAGFIDPTSGTVAFDGKDITRLAPEKRNTGMVFQSYALWPHMTVAENVAFGLDVRKVPAAEKAQRVKDALAAVQMAEYAARRPTQLSGGQQQRVALARALVVRPDVLLLDEPLSNLDAKLRLELRSEIRRICKDAGITGVYVTHDQKEALSMADRIAIMSRGKLVQLGTPHDLYTAPANRFVAEFLGETNFLDATVADISPAGTRLDTPAGPILSSAKGSDRFPKGTKVLLSLRPEALTLREPNTPASFRATLRHTVYLGEMAQHVVDVAGPNWAPVATMRVAEFNPRALHARGQGSAAALTVKPDDVVVVPAD